MISEAQKSLPSTKGQRLPLCYAILYGIVQGK